MEKKVPAPNYYKPENVNLHLKGTPKISMGIKYSEFCSTGLPCPSEENDLI
jgi:hypothetical protein